MHGSIEYEAWRQRSEGMRQEIATNRLGRKLRADRGGERPRVARGLSRQLARHAGLLGKRLFGHAA